MRFAWRIRALTQWLKRWLKPEPEAWLEHVRGVIHVGANLGQERFIYRNYELPVIWVEPIPEIFKRLEANIASISGQRAYSYLLSDKDGQDVAFHIANNDGASSSMLDMKLHKDVWPDVAFEKTIVLTTCTFQSMVEREHIDIRPFDALVLDTQGADLYVLRGAGLLLRQFVYVKVEVPDFEAYAGCCRLDELTAFMRGSGFRVYSCRSFARRAGGGAYYDVLFRRTRR